MRNMTTVNLDAMIIREDFAVEDVNASANIQSTISINDLAGNYLTSVIRKPDFQRETRDWTAKNVLNFIESIIKGQFIPSLILWKNASGFIFVIDGAHRLSALIAWMNDDYGDGIISRKFYQNNIPEDQLKAAVNLRKLINKNVGTYMDYEKALNNPEVYEQNFVQTSRLLRTFAFSIQWITGNVEVAEESFFNINQRAVKINNTEINLLRARKCDHCIAARAIMYSGSGNKYWKEFNNESQNQIVNLAQEINVLLFEPKYEKPIKTLDLPMCGKNQSNLTFIYDMISNVCNVEKREDIDGTLTINILQKVKKILERILSKQPGSLGLHPIIYFYSNKGNFKTSSFYAILRFVEILENRNMLKDFTSVREKYEDFIYRYSYIFDQINRSLRSTKKSVPVLTSLYYDILLYLKDGNDYEEILQKIIISDKYPKLIIDRELSNVMKNSDFNINRKSEVFINDFLPHAVKCPLCGGLLHKNSISIDHIIRKEDGGMSEASNGQTTHFYCNTTYKN